MNNKHEMTGPLSDFGIWALREGDRIVYEYEPNEFERGTIIKIEPTESSVPLRDRVLDRDSQLNDPKYNRIFTVMSDNDETREIEGDQIIRKLSYNESIENSIAPQHASVLHAYREMQEAKKKKKKKSSTVLKSQKNDLSSGRKPGEYSKRGVANPYN